MKLLIATVATLLITQIQASVTYNPTTRTYTIDQYGYSVELNKKKYNIKKPRTYKEHLSQLNEQKQIFI